MASIIATVSGLKSESGGIVYGRSIITIGPIFESNFTISVDR